MDKKGIEKDIQNPLLILIFPHTLILPSFLVIKCAIDMSSEQAKPSVQAFGRKVRNEGILCGFG